MGLETGQELDLKGLLAVLVILQFIFKGSDMS